MTGLNYDFKGQQQIQLPNIKPDAIGLDIGLSGGAAIVGAGAGLNILWHTRGEDNNLIPEVHLYYSLGGSTAAGVSGNVGIFCAWAYDEFNKRANDRYVANGFNWTGYFWSMGLSAGEGMASGGACIFTSNNPCTSGNENLPYWNGFEISWTPGINCIKVPKQLNKASSGIVSGNWLRSDYFLLWGNGHDYLPSTNKNISGLNWPPVGASDDKK